MHPNSLDLIPAIIATISAVTFAALWIRARRRAATANRRADRMVARADVTLIAAKEFHAQLTERERAVAAGRIESRRRGHLELVA